MTAPRGGDFFLTQNLTLMPRSAPPSTSAPSFRSSRRASRWPFSTAHARHRRKQCITDLILRDTEATINPLTLTSASSQSRGPNQHLMVCSKLNYLEAAHQRARLLTKLLICPVTQRNYGGVCHRGGAGGAGTCILNFWTHLQNSPQGVHF